MNDILKKIIAQRDFLQEEHFLPAESGTVHEVYLSTEYVVRIREKQRAILSRESTLLRSLNHPLIPKIICEGAIDHSSYAVENRLAGETIDTVWKDLPVPDKSKIIDDIITLLQYLRTQKADSIYSVKTGVKYDNFYKYLTDNIAGKIEKINKYECGKEMLGELLGIIRSNQAEKLFDNSQITLVHGDLVFHNLLTNKKHLTGVLDWELALYGDPDYDIFRLMNFQCSAKIYQDQGCDDDFEFEYLDQLLSRISESGIADTKSENFKAKYLIVRGAYYLNALYWAAGSDDAEKNIIDVVGQWKTII